MLVVQNILKTAFQSKAPDEKYCSRSYPLITHLLLVVNMLTFNNKTARTGNDSLWGVTQ